MPLYILKLLMLGGLGVVIGGVGTMVGLGGGFALIPLLIYVFPLKDADRSAAAATSLAAVFLNAASGTFSYARQKRIDYFAGVVMAIPAIPAAVLGAWVIKALGGRHEAFDITFAVVAVVMAVILVIGRTLFKRAERAAAGRGQKRHFLVYDRKKMLPNGESAHYQFNVRAGMLIGLVGGFLAGFLGIGGGIVHMPLLILVMGFPAHIAAATSHFILLLTTSSATVFNLQAGKVDLDYAVPIGAGMVIGANIGARIAKSATGWVIRVVLALILFFVALQMIRSVF
jgi:hypothetical protein